MSENGYVADELTHFVGRAESTDERRYDVLKQILTEERLAHPPFDPWNEGIVAVKTSASLCNNEMYDEHVVCFCDIPLQLLSLHMQKFSTFGLAFSKSFLVSQGASPVFYVSRNASSRSPAKQPKASELRRFAASEDPRDLLRLQYDSKSRCEYFDDEIRSLHQLMSDWTWLVMENPGPDQVEQINRISRAQWFLARYVFGFVKFFDESLEEADEDNYYMEREWRVVGAVSFTHRDIARVIIPTQFEARFRRDFSEYAGELYLVP